MVQLSLHYLVESKGNPYTLLRGSGEGDCAHIQKRRSKMTHQGQRSSGEGHRSGNSGSGRKLEEAEVDSPLTPLKGCCETDK